MHTARAVTDIKQPSCSALGPGSVPGDTVLSCETRRGGCTARRGQHPSHHLSSVAFPRPVPGEPLGTQPARPRRQVRVAATRTRSLSMQAPAWPGRARGLCVACSCQLTTNVLLWACPHPHVLLIFFLPPAPPRRLRPRSNTWRHGRGRAVPTWNTLCAARCPAGTWPPCSALCAGWPRT